MDVNNLRKIEVLPEKETVNNDASNTLRLWILRCIKEGGRRTSLRVFLHPFHAPPTGFRSSNHSLHFLLSNFIASRKVCPVLTLISSIPCRLITSFLPNFFPSSIVQPSFLCLNFNRDFLVELVETYTGRTGKPPRLGVYSLKSPSNLRFRETHGEG